MTYTENWFVPVLSAIERKGRWLSNYNTATHKDFQNWNNVIRFLARSQSVNKEHTELALYVLGHDGYRLKKPIQACVDRISGDEVIAAFPEAGISICGDSPTEAIQMLKTEIVELYEILKKEARLGPEPQRQLLVLEKYIGQGG